MVRTSMRLVDNYRAFGVCWKLICLTEVARIVTAEHVDFYYHVGPFHLPKAIVGLWFG